MVFYLKKYSRINVHYILSLIWLGTLKDPVGGIYYQTWANYYLKFFQQYKNNQIDFWGVTAQHEPTDGYLYKFSFNAMGFTPESQSAFVKIVLKMIFLFTHKWINP